MKLRFIACVLIAAFMLFACDDVIQNQLVSTFDLNVADDPGMPEHIPMQDPGDNPMTAISVTVAEGAAASVKAGETLQLVATLTALDPDEEITNQNIYWYSNGDALATVDQNGLVTAKKAGSITIYAASLSVKGLRGSRAVTVTVGDLTEVVINESAVSFTAGNTLQLRATAYTGIDLMTGTNAPTYAWTAEPAGLTFSSATNATPAITSSTPGNYTVTLTGTRSGISKTATVDVTVLPVPAAFDFAGEHSLIVRHLGVSGPISTPAAGELIKWTGNTWGSVAHQVVAAGAATEALNTVTVFNTYNLADIGGRYVTNTNIPGFQIAPTDSTIVYLDTPIKGDVGYIFEVRMSLLSTNYGSNAGGAFVGAAVDPATMPSSSLWYQAGFARANGVQATDPDRTCNRPLYTMGTNIIVNIPIQSANGNTATGYPNSLIPQEMQNPYYTQQPTMWTWRLTYDPSITGAGKYQVGIYGNATYTRAAIVDEPIGGGRPNTHRTGTFNGTGAVSTTSTSWLTGSTVPITGTSANQLNNVLANANAYYTPVLILGGTRARIEGVSIRPLN